MVNFATDTVVGRPFNIDNGGAQELLDRGLVLSMMGDRTEAISQYRRALEIEPDSAIGRYMLGLSLMATGRTDEALTEWRRVLHTTQPGSHAAWARWKVQSLFDSNWIEDSKNGKHDGSNANFRRDDGAGSHDHGMQPALARRLR